MNSALVQDSEEGDFQAGDQVGGGAGREADPSPGGEDSGHRQARPGGNAPHGRYLHRQEDSQEIVNHPGRLLMLFVNFLSCSILLRDFISYIEKEEEGFTTMQIHSNVNTRF